jgi:hypothetical protein
VCLAVLGACAPGSSRPVSLLLKIRFEFHVVFADINAEGAELRIERRASALRQQKVLVHAPSRITPRRILNDRQFMVAIDEIDFNNPD